VLNSCKAIIGPFPPESAYEIDGVIANLHTPSDNIGIFLVNKRIETASRLPYNKGMDKTVCSAVNLFYY